MVEVSNLHRTEAFVSHRNARLTVHGRRLLVEHVRSGRPVAHVAAEMGMIPGSGLMATAMVALTGAVVTIVIQRTFFNASPR